MVSGLPRLFPGAPATCVSAKLTRTCDGEATLGTDISIADQIPPGVTEISDLSFQVLNPQNGVSVQMRTQPTYGNGWVAGFNVTRSNSPSPVNVRITFKVKITSTEKRRGCTRVCHQFQKCLIILLFKHLFHTDERSLLLAR